MNYEDSPIDNLNLLKSLTKKELRAYVKGYLLAMSHMKESISGGKMEILNAVFDMEDDQETFLGYVALLDAYELRIDARAQELKKLFPDIFDKDVKTA